MNLFVMKGFTSIFPALHQGKCPREDMRIAKNAFDPRLLCLHGHNIKGNRGKRDTDVYHATTRTERFKQTLHCARIATGFKNYIRSPAVRSLSQHVGKILIPYIHRSDSRIGPAPMTTAISPARIRALLAPCIPTASGSTIAPSAKETLSGNLKVNAAGCATVVRKQPCMGGVAQNRTAGSRL